jgi:DNA polymerase I-like protein with 3'-5' exonuclease and polymerase domains
MLVFDIETDGLLPELTTIHSLCLYDTDTNTLTSCADHEGYSTIQEGLSLLKASPFICGHNIQAFDLPAIKKVYPDWRPSGQYMDTLIVTRLIWPEIIAWDVTNKRVPSHCKGKHSLEAWGHRLKVYKGDYGKTESWAKWSPEMQKYCEQDVMATVALLHRIEKENYSEQAIKLEHDFAAIIRQQEANGVCFNYAKAYQMAMELEKEVTLLAQEITATTPTLKKTVPFTPKRDNKAKGWVAGQTINRVHEIPFNPNSRDHIAKFFKKVYGWEPVELTPTERPKISGDILRDLPYKEAAVMAKYLDANKLLSTIYVGDGAWLKLQRNNKIYGKMITNGCLTGRCSHYGPNLGNIPSPRSYRGGECRELFYAPEGMVMVGADASQIELRCLAHYLYRYDQGEYTNAIMLGDIHTFNQQKAGLPDRDSAKRFIYALNYGAGQAKLGSIVVPDAGPIEQLRVGKQMKQNFLYSTKGFKELLDTLEATLLSRGYLTGLDGRRLVPRESYRGLNTLLQSAGAVIMKQANVFFWEKMGTMVGDDYARVVQVLNVHDEIQLYAPVNLGDQIGQMLVDSIRETTQYFKLKCPMDGQYKIGKTWHDTH